jgi:hypothetical protein
MRWRNPTKIPFPPPQSRWTLPDRTADHGQTLPLLHLDVSNLALSPDTILGSLPACFCLSVRGRYDVLDEHLAPYTYCGRSSRKITARCSDCTVERIFQLATTPTPKSRVDQAGQASIDPELPITHATAVDSISRAGLHHGGRSLGTSIIF